MIPKGKRIIAFDMDGTITNSRSLINPGMEDVLKILSAAFEVIIITGANINQMIKQIPFLGDPGCPIHILSQTGNVYTWHGIEKWNRKMAWWQQYSCLKHIIALKKKYKVISLTPIEDKVAAEADTVENRGSQITYSLIGANAPLEKKKEFDPEGLIRNQMLADTPFVHPDLVATCGGTTSIDYVFRDGNKGCNLAKLQDFMGWKREDCLYVGDAIYDGGNDESVIGVWDTFSVKNPEETYKLLTE